MTKPSKINLLKRVNWGLIFLTLALMLFQRVVVIQNCEYLRAADTYVNLIIADDIAQTSKIPPTRPLTLPRFGDTTNKLVAVEMAAINLIAGLDSFNIIKWFLPLSISLIIFAVIFLLIKKMTGNTQWTGTILFLSSVLLFLNAAPYHASKPISYATPQGFALVFFTILVFLAFRYFQKETIINEEAVLILWFFLSWVAFHASHWFFIPILIASIFCKRPRQLRNLKTIIAIATIIGLFLFWKRNELTFIISFFLSKTQKTTLTFEYIKDTVSPFLLIFAIIGITTFWKEKHNSGEKKFFWFLLMNFFVLFLFIIIFPKFGLANSVYTYRFLGYLVIVLLILSFYFFKYLLKDGSLIAKISIIFLVPIVLLPSLPRHFEKGWILGKEKQVIEFIKNNTPPNSIFFTQEMNGPIIVLAKRTVFKQGSVMEEQQNPLTHNNKHIFYSNSGKNSWQSIQDCLSPTNTLYQWGSYKKPTADDQQRPKYVLYSKLKTRINQNFGDWWVKGNYPNAHLYIFNDTNYFEKVFENEDIILWKVRQDISL